MLLCAGIKDAAAEDLIAEPAIKQVGHIPVDEMGDSGYHRTSVDLGCGSKAGF